MGRISHARDSFHGNGVNRNPVHYSISISRGVSHFTLHFHSLALHYAMSVDFAALETYITQILTSPNTNLDKISAKAVRKRLPELDASLTGEVLEMEENKGRIKELIGVVFERVRSQTAQEEGDNTKEEGDEDSAEEDGEDEERATEPQSSPGPSLAAKPKTTTQKKKKTEVSDAELAKKLSSELNSNSRSSRRSTTSTSTSKTSKTKNASPRKQKKAKSAAMIDSDSEIEDEDEEGAGEPGGKKKTKKAKRKTPTTTAEGGGAKGGFKKEYVLRYVSLYTYHHFQRLMTCIDI